MNAGTRENREARGGRGRGKREEVVRAREEDGRVANERRAPNRILPSSRLASFFPPPPPPFLYERARGIQGRISEINKRKPFNLTPARRR